MWSIRKKAIYFFAKKACSVTKNQKVLEREHKHNAHVR